MFTKTLATAADGPLMIGRTSLRPLASVHDDLDAAMEEAR